MYQKYVSQNKGGYHNTQLTGIRHYNADRHFENNTPHSLRLIAPGMVVSGCLFYGNVVVDSGFGGRPVFSGINFIRKDAGFIGTGVEKQRSLVVLGNTANHGQIFLGGVEKGVKAGSLGNPVPGIILRGGNPAVFQALGAGNNSSGVTFYVNTDTNQVRVVGTHFNVCAYKGSNEFETTLVEGIVDIYAYDNERPLTRLTKNEFFGSYQGKYKKAVLPSYDYLRWREGLYCFDDSPFSCILTKLEKYYNVKITVENPKVLNYRCTGKFKEQDGVEHILKVIQKDHPFTYSISEEGDSIRIE